MRSVERIKVQEALKKVSGGLPWKRVFIYGPEDYLTEQFIKKVSETTTIEKFFPENIEGFLSFTGSSLFGSSKVPVILHAEELPSVLRKKSEREPFLKKLTEVEGFIVASFGEIDSKTLKGELFSKILKSTEVVIYSEHLSEKALRNLVKKKLSEKKVSDEIVSLIVERVGSSLRELRNETDKLLNYPGELTEEVVELLLSSSGKVNVFELIFLLTGGEGKEFLKGVEKLLNGGSEPLQIIGLLQSQTRQMVNLLTGRNVKMPKEALKKTREAASRLGTKRALKLLKLLNEAEFSVKTGRKTGEEALKGLPFEFKG